MTIELFRAAEAVVNAGCTCETAYSSHYDHCLITTTKKRLKEAVEVMREQDGIMP